ncbi:MAG: response regulator [Bdellovibrionota bacterium]
MVAPKKPLVGSKILCVDDEPLILSILQNILTRYGAQVTTCSSAAEAIAALEKEQFGVVISDLSMPGLDGYDLAHALREMEDNDSTREATPTIAVSGDAFRPSRKRRFADFQVYMEKPVDQSRLVYVVERLLEADSEAVKLGSLGSWEADEATKAATVATKVAEVATAVASEAIVAAADATMAAEDATAAAAAAKAAALAAEIEASSSAAHAPPRQSRSS